MDESFDAVYYSSPVPRSQSLTLLALVFDRIHFPGVYVPDGGPYRQEIQSEIKRIEEAFKAKGPLDMDDALLLNSMSFSLHMEHVKEFCVFTGKPGQMGILEEGARELADELEVAIYGPPEEGFYPMFNVGFSKGLIRDASGEEAVNGPSWLTYPSNALVYAARHGRLLVNDDPRIPVIPGYGRTPKSEAKHLAMALALESVRMALPTLRDMQPRQIAEFREATKDLVRPFRTKMLLLSRKLNEAIDADSSPEEVAKEARFLAETEVYAELEELRRVIEEPSRPWHKFAVDFGEIAPELAAGWWDPVVWAKVLGKVVASLGSLRDGERAKEEGVRKSGFHYLLRVGELGKN